MTCRCRTKVLPAGAGDRGGAGVGLETACGGESGSVVTDLGEYSGAGEWAEPGEAGDDLRIRVLGEEHTDGFGEGLGGCAGGIELLQQRHQADSHRRFDLRWLAKRWGAHDVPQSFDVAVDESGTSGPLEYRPKLGAGQGGSCGWSRSRSEHAAGIGAGQPVFEGLKRDQSCWVVLLEERADLVLEALPRPDGVLLGAGENPNGQSTVGVVRQRAVRTGDGARYLPA